MKKWIHQPPSGDTPRIYIFEVDENREIKASMAQWKELPEPGLYRIQRVSRDDEAWIWKNTQPTFKYRPDEWDGMCGAESPGLHPSLCVLKPGHDGYHKAY